MSEGLHLIEEDLNWWIERAHRHLLIEIEWFLFKHAEFQRLYPE
jgi:hypothetical protein